jgi:hypothetical protein
MINFSVLAQSEAGFFSGRISRYSKDIKTLKIKVDFPNVKYVNTRDQIEFWDERNSAQRCRGYILGRSPDFLLVKVPELETCEKFIFVTTGAYLKFFSKDLQNNLEMGRDVVDILLKKRMAVQGQIDLRDKELDSHIERVGAVNARYDTLRKKLEMEWQKELNSLEEDRVQSIRLTKDLERRRDEIDKKLELYKVNDENMKIDRWSLDSRLYYKK